MTYRLAIFDFDGTLADSFPFFVQVFNQLAERHGFRKIEPERVPSFRGHSPRQMMAHVGLPSWRLPLVAKDFIVLMRANIDAIEPFEGVGDALSHLSHQGLGLAVVSSNSIDNIRTVLGPETASRIGHFECGMSIFGKSSRIGRTLAKTGVSAREAIYIGDQVTDLQASRKAGVSFGAVSWGYGSIESIREHSPDEEFDRVPDLKRMA
jgi:phosphoglycolate phosphatase